MKVIFKFYFKNNEHNSLNLYKKQTNKQKYSITIKN